MKAEQLHHTDRQATVYIDARIDAALGQHGLTDEQIKIIAPDCASNADSCARDNTTAAEWADTFCASIEGYIEFHNIL